MNKSVRRYHERRGLKTGAPADVIALGLIVLGLIPALSCQSPQQPEEGRKAAYAQVIRLGKWDERSLNGVIRAASQIPDPGERIGYISAHFLGTRYEPDTLVGGKDIKETLVVNLEGMDCFTYLDYVEAMRLSSSLGEFGGNIKTVRYRGGKVDYKSRKHFFTQWKSGSPENIRDITRDVGSALTASKNLNLKEDGSLYLPAIPVKRQLVSYIPGAVIDDAVIAKLKTGDYIGVYTETEGLGVSHTGIFIRKGGKTYFRHASSKTALMKVADEDFKTYFADKPGIVVFRAK